MRIRSELANRLRRYTEDRQAPSGQPKGNSFKETLSNQNAGVHAYDRTNTNARRSAHYPASHAQHHPKKEITLTQANRLAKYAPRIQECSRKYNVPVELICAVILQESGGNSRAVSRAGARGLMQLMPATARRFGVTNSFDPNQNIEGGTKYLRSLMDRFNGDYRLVLAGYNAGEGNVTKHGNTIPPFSETRAYVPAVLSYADSIWQILHSGPAANLPPHARRA